MAIKYKIANTAKELDDVFKLRYDVFVIDKGKFCQNSVCISDKNRIVDRFDCIPDVSNIIVYDDDIPIATMRVNKDSEIGLPAEKHFDFSSSREQITLDCQKKQINQVIGSAGMLAIKKEWRHRRSIILSMFKTAISIMHKFGATHLITSVSEETQSLYGRLGFNAVGESQWSESIGDQLVPMLAPFEKVLHWGFGDIYSSNKLETFNQKVRSVMAKSKTLNNIEQLDISRSYLQAVA